MGKRKAYDFKNVEFIITLPNGTPYYVTGFASGSTIVVEKKSDKYTGHTGAKGDTTYAKNNDNSGTIKIKLKSDSESVGVLNTLAESDYEFPVMINDSNDSTKSTCKADGCVIQKPGNYERGPEITGSEWTIACPSIDTEYPNATAIE